MTSRYFLSSAGIHLALLWLLLFSPWSHRGVSDAIMLDGFEYIAGGGKGNGPAAGPKQEQMGQVVPQPVKVQVPQKAAPVQKAQTAEEAWKIKNAKEPPKVEKTPVVEPPAPIQRGEKAQEEKTNIIRRGVAPNTKAGEGGFDFGTPGDTTGSGKGVGIGVGDGEGPGFGGFGSYFRIVRQRIWSEWTQSAVYGSNETCIIGFTILRSGDVTSIKIETPSSNGFYDSVALRAVRNATPLPPLPTTFPSDEKRVRIQFRLLE